MIVAIFIEWRLENNVFFDRGASKPGSLWDIGDGTSATKGSLKFIDFSKDGRQKRAFSWAYSAYDTHKLSSMNAHFGHNEAI